MMRRVDVVVVQSKMRDALHRCCHQEVVVPASVLLLKHCWTLAVFDYVSKSQHISLR
jgi:hypothetical protein